MLRNEKYHGVVVWDRTRKERNPETHKKVSARRPESEWRHVNVPELRIVPEELWIAVQRRKEDTKKTGIPRTGGQCRTRTSRTYLFSGLLTCGLCNQSVVIVSGGGKRGYTKYGCHSHKHRGTCDNALTIRRERLEDQLLAVIEQRVLKPEIIDYLIRRREEEVRVRFKEMQKEGTFLTVDQLKRERDGLQAQAAQLAKAIGLGGNLESLVARLREVETEAKRLTGAIAS